MIFVGIILSAVILFVLIILCFNIFGYSPSVFKSLNPRLVKVRELEDLVGKGYDFTPYFKDLLNKNDLSDGYGKAVIENVKSFIFNSSNFKRINLDVELKRFIELQIDQNIEKRKIEEEWERESRLKEAQLRERQHYVSRIRNVSLSTRTLVLERDNYTCQMCGRTRYDGVKLEVDHIIPFSKGGSDDISNLQTLCFDCNRGKSDKILHNQINR